MVLCTLLYYVVEASLCWVFFTLISFIALKVLESKSNVRCKCKGRLDGKTVLITGGSMGIGFATAKILASRGARVIITCVNEHTAKAAAEELVAATGNEHIHYRQLDLSSFDNVQSFATDFNKSFDKLHILVNNAGMRGAEDFLTGDGIEITLQVNFVAQALLTQLLLPKLRYSKPSRIVFVTSKLSLVADFQFEDFTLGRKHVEILKKYANSKLLQILWTKALSTRLPAGVTVNAVHPGIVQTNIYSDAKHYILSKLISLALGMLFKTPEQGAQCTVHACLSPHLEGLSGQYIADCRVLNEEIPALKNDEFVEKVFKKTSTLIDSRLSDETRL